MAITAVSSSELPETGTNTNPRVFTVDVGTRTNGLLVVGVFALDSTARTISSATYAGVSMGIAIQRTDTLGSPATVALLYLANPTNGSNTLSVTFSGMTTSTTTYLLPSWWDGAHQTQASVLDQTAGATGSTDPSLVITPGTNNQLIVSQYFSEAAAVLTVGADETLLQNHDFGPRTVGGSYVIQTTAGAQTVDWTGVDDVWNMVAASFKEAAGGASASGPLITGKLVGHGALLGRLVN